MVCPALDRGGKPGGATITQCMVCPALDRGGTGWNNHKSQSKPIPIHQETPKILLQPGQQQPRRQPGLQNPGLQSRVTLGNGSRTTSHIGRRSSMERINGFIWTPQVDRGTQNSARQNNGIIRTTSNTGDNRFNKPRRQPG